jgi:transposase
MARYKEYSYEQGKFIPIAFDKQILPGTFEYTLSYLIDHEIDLSMFDARYRNDETGAPAYDPALLLKIVLYAYSRGITSSREMERACRENVMFMALSADTQPHFSTIADFISGMGEQIVPLFRNVVLICDELGLIGQEMFAIDGCKLPSNASKEWSGTKAELTAKKRKLEKAIRGIVARHRASDARGQDAALPAHEQQYIATLKAQVKKLKRWLDANDDKPGKSGKPKKSNLTDNESAKIKTGKGVIQGYDGVASVDAKRQVVVHAEAFGEAQEHDLLVPMVEGTQANLRAIGRVDGLSPRSKLSADSGFHNEANVRYLYEAGIDAYLPDTGFRKRDPRFAAVERFRARSKHDKQLYFGRTPKRFTSPDFHYDPKTHTCICPAGKQLYSNGRANNLGGYEALKFRGAKRDCVPCPLRAQCMRDPSKTQTRQVAIFIGRSKQAPPRYIDQMRQKIDTLEGRRHYSRRLGIVEPVFANLCSSLGLRRFSLRTRCKVDIQWKLYCTVHNLLKIHRYGPGFT